MDRRSVDTAALVEQIGRLKGRIEELEASLHGERARAERQRAACVAHVEQEARLAQNTAEHCSGTARATSLAVAAELRSVAAEMRARAVVR